MPAPATSRARLADGLTAGRAAMAPVLALLLAKDLLEAAAVVLALCWVSDLLDGRIARRAGGGTRLGGLDLAADTVVGAGVVLGLGLGGTLPWGVAVALLALLGGAYAVFRIEAAGMLLQAVGYGAVLVRLAARGSPWLAVPVGAVAFIAVVDRDRFLHDVLPRFFHGFAPKPGVRGPNGSDP
jgi:phosphatidylglycerophosphate synthase